MEKILLAIVIGGAFGFVLDRIGATNPNMIIHMLRLSKLHLMKTILLGIGVSSLVMFVGLLAGVIDVAHMSIKTAYIGVFVGGLLLGLGFAIAGYCPGTGLSAMATGRKDAAFFVLGGLVGAAAYMVTYAPIKATGILDKVLGGKVSLGAIEGSKYPSLIDGVPGEFIGIGLGVVFIVIAFVLPDRLRGNAEG